MLTLWVASNVVFHWVPNFTCSVITWVNLVTGPNTTKRFACLEEISDAVSTSFQMEHGHRGEICGSLTGNLAAGEVS